MKYKCKFCAKRNAKCFKCCKILNNPSSHENIYCVSCKDWFCHDCLCPTLSTDEVKLYTTTDLPFFCNDCSIDYYCPICQDICRDKCIFCNHCEKFIHVKCTKLTRRQVRSYARCGNYICSICIKNNLPVNLFAKPDSNALNMALPTSCTNTPIYNPSSSNPDSAGCGLCIECDTECLNCDLCPDIQRVCSLCLSCKNYTISGYNQLLSTYNGKDRLIILHANARSLSANIKYIKQLIDKSKVVPDVIAISETWLNEDTENDFEIPGYKFVFKSIQAQAIQM